MRVAGTDTEWKRFTDAETVAEVREALRMRVHQIGDPYDDLNRILVGLWECPNSEIPDALLVARTALGEAMSLLEHVSNRLVEPPDTAA